MVGFYQSIIYYLSIRVPADFSERQDTPWVGYHSTGGRLLILNITLIVNVIVLTLTHGDALMVYKDKIAFSVSLR